MAGRPSRQAALPALGPFQNPPICAVLSGARGRRGGGRSPHHAFTAARGAGVAALTGPLRREGPKWHDFLTLRSSPA